MNHYLSYDGQLQYVPDSGPSYPGKWLPGTYCDVSEDGFTVNEVKGVTCNEQGYCEKRSFIDMVDYGMHNDFTVNCQSDGLCAIASGLFIASAQDMANNSYEKVYAPLLQAFYDQMWTQDTSGVTDCQDDTICQIMFKNRDIQGRCGAPDDSGKRPCEFRPMYIYGVNMYPNDVELVLAWTDDDTQYPEINFYAPLSGICDPVMAYTNWSPTRTEWLE